MLTLQADPSFINNDKISLYTNFGQLNLLQSALQVMEV